MKIVLKDNFFNDCLIINGRPSGMTLIGKNDHNEFNVEVRIYKQKTIELIEFLQECVKEME